MKAIKYSNDKITVVWKPELCQHSAICISELPEVFNVNEVKWINPNGAETDVIIEQVKRCPSGALSFFYNNQKAE